MPGLAMPSQIAMMSPRDSSAHRTGLGLPQTLASICYLLSDRTHPFRKAKYLPVLPSSLLSKRPGEAEREPCALGTGLFDDLTATANAISPPCSASSFFFLFRSLLLTHQDILNPAPHTPELGFSLLEPLVEDPHKVSGLSSTDHQLVPAGDSEVSAAVRHPQSTCPKEEAAEAACCPLGLGTTCCGRLFRGCSENKHSQLLYSGCRHLRGSDHNCRCLCHCACHFCS